MAAIRCHRQVRSTHTVQTNKVAVIQPNLSFKVSQKQSEQSNTASRLSWKKQSRDHLGECIPPLEGVVVSSPGLSPPLLGEAATWA